MTKINPAFKAIISDIFVLKGRRIVAHCEIVTGTIMIKDRVRIVGKDLPDLETQVDGIPIHEIDLNFNPAHQNDGTYCDLFFKPDPAQIEIGMTITSI